MVRTNAVASTSLDTILEGFSNSDFKEHQTYCHCCQPNEGTTTIQIALLSGFTLPTSIWLQKLLRKKLKINILIFYRYTTNQMIQYINNDL